MEHDLRVEYRFKNAILYRELAQAFETWAREQQRGSPHRGGVFGFMKFAAETMGVSYSMLNQLLCLRENPRSTNPNKQGQLWGAAQKVADFLGVSAESLFPETLYALRLPHVAVREFSSPKILSLQEAQMQHLLPSVAPEGEELIAQEEQQEELRKALDEVISTLTPREQLVTRARFGEPPESLNEIGARLGLSQERIRQIEVKALRKLRGSNRVDVLRKCLDRQMPAPSTPDLTVEEEELRCPSKT